MDRNATVIIDRGQGQKQTLTGKIVNENSSFVQVEFEDGIKAKDWPSFVEWFPKNSQQVNVYE